MLTPLRAEVAAALI